MNERWKKNRKKSQQKEKEGRKCAFGVLLLQFEWGKRTKKKTTTHRHSLHFLKIFFSFASGIFSQYATRYLHASYRPQVCCKGFLFCFLSFVLEATWHK